MIVSPGDEPATSLSQVLPRRRHCCRWRYVVVICLFLGNVVCYADRTNISVAILAMAEEQGWDEEFCGVVLSSFFVGYMLTQIIGGVATSCCGGKPVLATGVFFWSIFTLLTPVAARASKGPLGSGPLLAVRVLMGVAEGVAMPSTHGMLGRWVPPNERSAAVALATSGQFLGTVLAMACSPIVARDWPLVFYLFGGLGLFWLIGFLALTSSGPESHPRISNAEVEHILVALREEQTASAITTETGGVNKRMERMTTMRRRAPSSSSANRKRSSASSTGSERPGGSSAVSSTVQFSPIGDADIDVELGVDDDGDVKEEVGVEEDAGPSSSSSSSSSSSGPSPPPVGLPRARCGGWRWLGFLLCNKGMIGIMAAHFAHNYGFYVLLSWIPKYMSDLDVKTEDIGFYASLPYLAMLLADTPFALVVDRAIAVWPHRRLAVRKVAQALAFVVPSIAMIILISAGDGVSPGLATALLCVACTASTMSHSGYWPNLADLGGPRYAGLLCGVSNTVGTIPGIVGNVLTGHFLHQFGWTGVFVACTIMYLFGALLYLALARTARLDA